MGVAIPPNFCLTLRGTDSFHLPMNDDAPLALASRADACVRVVQNPRVMSRGHGPIRLVSEALAFKQEK